MKNHFKISSVELATRQMVFVQVMFYIHDFLFTIVLYIILSFCILGHKSTSTAELDYSH